MNQQNYLVAVTWTEQHTAIVRESDLPALWDTFEVGKWIEQLRKKGLTADRTFQSHCGIAEQVTMIEEQQCQTTSQTSENSEET